MECIRDEKPSSQVPSDVFDALSLNWRFDAIYGAHSAAKFMSFDRDVSLVTTVYATPSVSQYRRSGAGAPVPL